MGGLKLTNKEKASGLKEIGGTIQPFSIWHNPETGQEFPRLPSDAPNAANYMIRGFRMGPAPKELKEKWKAGAAQRAADAKARLEAAKSTTEHRRAEQGLGNEPQQPQTAELVKEVVEQVLGALGHGLPAQSAQAEETPNKAEETEAAPEGATQLKLL